jgi:hypothetical protein
MVMLSTCSCGLSPLDPKIYCSSEPCVTPALNSLVGENFVYVGVACVLHLFVLRSCVLRSRVCGVACCGVACVESRVAE